MWSVYNKVDDIPYKRYIHDTVNHSENFVDPLSGVYTQAIEGKLSVIKHTKPRVIKSREQLETHLFFLSMEETVSKQHVGFIPYGLE